MYNFLRLEFSRLSFRLPLPQERARIQQHMAALRAACAALYWCHRDCGERAPGRGAGELLKSLLEAVVSMVTWRHPDVSCPYLQRAYIILSKLSRLHAREFAKVFFWEGGS